MKLFLRTTLVVLWVATAVGPGCTRPGWAAPVDERQAALRIAEAQRAYEQDRFGDAIRHYQRAYGLTADPDLLLIIAHIYDRALGDATRAQPYYQLYLATEPMASDQVRAELERVTELTGVARLRIVAPPGLEIRIDDDIKGRTPLTTRIDLVPGRHRISLFRASELRYRSRFDLSAGPQILDVELPTEAPDRRLLWGVSGLAAGSSVAWGTTASIALIQDDRQTAVAADVLLGVTVGLVVTGLILWIAE